LVNDKFLHVVKGITCNNLNGTWKKNRGWTFKILKISYR
jgi:hypothetical protein